MTDGENHVGGGAQDPVSRCRCLYASPTTLLPRDGSLFLNVSPETLEAEARRSLVGPAQEDGLSVDTVQGFLLGAPSDSLPPFTTARLDPAQLALDFPSHAYDA
jgi:hypothetical protein